MRILYDITGGLVGKRADASEPVKDMNGNIIGTPDQQLEIWREHFSSLLNRAEVEDPPDIGEGEKHDLEWQSHLCVNYIHFRKAFDMVERTTIWKILRHYGVPVKIVRLIQELYDNTKWFSHLQRILVVALRAENGTPDQQSEVHWAGSRHYNKIKTLRINAQHDTTITLDGQDIDDVGSFTFSGIVVSFTGRADADIKVRIGKARHAFTTTIWKNMNISLKTKLRLFQSNVKSVLLYWFTDLEANNEDRNIPPSVHQQVPYPDTADQMARGNIQQRPLGKDKPILSLQHIYIRERKWRWVGHIHRRPRVSINRHALLL